MHYLVIKHFKNIHGWYFTVVWYLFLITLYSVRTNYVEHVTTSNSREQLMLDDQQNLTNSNCVLGEWALSS